jgi:hypothetical protein
MKVLIPFLLSALLFLSCNSGDKQSATTTTEANLSEIIKAADAISPDLNSIEDVFSTLELAKAKYYPVLTSDPYNAPNYLKSKTAAASNLGIYVADMVYHSYGDATDKVFITFSASQELARYIGLESEFAATVLTELEGGQISRDSLITVFNNLMASSHEYNSEEEMMHVHAAFLAGLYVEKLYITSSLLEQGLKTEKTTQEDTENFITLLAIFNKQLETIDALESTIEKHRNELKDLVVADDFQKISSLSKLLKVKTDQIVSSNKMADLPELTEIYKSVSSIRTNITSAS